jgi:hypothetical protein
LSAAEADFTGQLALIATMHGKQAAFAGPLQTLGFTVQTPEDFDTDRFGTFSGEVERAGDMLDAARAKARAAFLHAGGTADWVIASEGAFGPSAALPMLAQGRELVLAWRPVDDHEVVVTRASFDTNFSHFDITPDRPQEAELQAWLDRIGFPDHAIIVRDGNRSVKKGLKSAFAIGESISAISGPIRLETDMRAHLNPTRMGQLSILGSILAERLACPCPTCAQPGFGRAGVEPGLPCGACGTPTELVLNEIWSCSACDHTQKRARTDGRTEAEPGECPACNP